MDRDIAISVKGVSKSYRMYESPAHRMLELLHPLKKKYHRDFWALRDINLDVQRGVTFGIIGKNGAGKSTLLQVICGILPPTTGSVHTAGRITGLLELGTGFNKEFTGIENVFLQGAMMGVSREEMEERLEKIAEFADIGDFIDRPAKTYSSGMYIRLGFACAVHIDPEILILDEGLSVGDVRFQQKCFRKMKEIQEQGTTILLVTHNTGAITNFCDEAVWINDGRIVQTGDPTDVVKEYLAYMSYDAVVTKKTPVKEGNAPVQLRDKTERHEIEWEDVSRCESFGEGGVEIKRVAFRVRDNLASLRVFNVPKGGEQVILTLDIDAKEDLLNPIAGFILKDGKGNSILGISNTMFDKNLPALKKGERVLVDFEFKFPRLKVGQYSFDVAIGDGTHESHVQHHWVHDAYIVQIASADLAGKIGGFYVVEDAVVRVETPGHTVS